MLSFSEQDNIFHATASEALVVVNHGLSYRLTFVLANFEYDEFHDIIRYLLYPHYEELEPAVEQERQKFQQCRLEAYQGSLQHFLRMLVQHRNVHTDVFSAITGYRLATDYPSYNFSPRAT